MGSSRERSKSTYTKHFSWFYVDRLIEKLLKRMEGESRHFESIVAVPRGGLIPGTILSHRLQRPLYCLDWSADAPMDFCGEVLMVEDVVDTGKALQKARKLVRTVDDSRIWYASLIRKLWAPPIDFWAEQEDAWVEFPWEKANRYGI
jgi:hypoxanthine phosphoribosyltransferase